MPVRMHRLKLRLRMIAVMAHKLVQTSKEISESTRVRDLRHVNQRKKMWMTTNAMGTVHAAIFLRGSAKAVKHQFKFSPLQNSTKVLGGHTSNSTFLGGNQCSDLHYWDHL
mmetsp:Transcript_41793/g.89066  ORF Transcript_41793/g.89066 Transcript_41793/m.89066 type:complete len:111 (+) Transcript_41793:166-498(+)